ncbi:hypothetical protein [Nostoc sp. GT001]|uniref:hypothetical protein n=1 Tax=Nostoc sp. GT001 TaxID=3056647 RepID=UPI0025AAE4B3|nr:hypothetical protein [Nostoc sp. GT001]MDM9585160.1 hypothetical protein [Nostoc sp. GT001]
MTSSNYSRFSFELIIHDIRHIKSFLDTIPMWRFFLSKKKINCVIVRNIANLIEDRLNEEIQLIAQLNQSLSDWNSFTRKVLLAREKASSAAYILTTSTKQTGYKDIFANQAQTEYGEISSDINQLRFLKESESDMGKLDLSLDLIRDIIRDLNNCSQDDVKMAIKLFNDTATQYTDMQRTISKIIARVLRS